MNGQLPESIRRRDNGSIDTGFYLARASDLRGAAIRDILSLPRTVGKSSRTDTACSCRMSAAVESASPAVTLRNPLRWKLNDIATLD